MKPNLNCLLLDTKVVIAMMKELQRRNQSDRLLKLVETKYAELMDCPNKYNGNLAWELQRLLKKSKVEKKE